MKFVNAAEQMSLITNNFLALVGQVKDRGLQEQLLKDFLSVMFDVTNEILPSPHSKSVWLKHTAKDLLNYLEENRKSFNKIDLRTPNQG